MRAELRDSLENLFPDSTPSAIPAKELTIDVARGGTAAVHIFLNELKSSDTVAFQVKKKSKETVNAEWFRLIDVPVEENTGLVSFTEKTAGENPHVIRRAPFRIYDAMEPVEKSVKVKESTLTLRLQIPINLGVKPGKTVCEIDVKSGNDTASLRFIVNVHKASIPPVGKSSWPYTNWFSFDLMAERHGLKPWTEPHWKMIRNYADLMVRARQNTFWVTAHDVFKRTKAGLELNRERLRRIVKLFTGAGMYFIEGGHLAGRTKGEWDSPTFSTVLDGDLVTSKNGHRDLAVAAKQLMEEIETNGWRARWLQHATDEPTDKQAADYRILTGIIHKYMSGIPILDATMHVDLVGSCNYWCPQCQEYQKNRVEFEALREYGDKIWFYTCCCPGGAWLNRLLDQELLRPTLFGWAGAKFNLDGFLHWGLNHYRPDQDPFQKSVVGHGGSNKLPAGDTHVVYPGKDAPWSSLRLEAQREGCEDYELLKKLKAKNPKAAEKIIRMAFRAFDDYTKDVKTFRKARKSLLEKACD